MTQAQPKQTGLWIPLAIGSFMIVAGWAILSITPVQNATGADICEGFMSAPEQFGTACGNWR